MSWRLETPKGLCDDISKATPQSMSGFCIHREDNEQNISRIEKFWFLFCIKDIHSVLTKLKK